MRISIPKDTDQYVRQPKPKRADGNRVVARCALESPELKVVLYDVQHHVELREEGHAMAPPLQPHKEAVQDGHLAGGAHKILT